MPPRTVAALMLLAACQAPVGTGPRPVDDETSGVIAIRLVSPAGYTVGGSLRVAVSGGRAWLFAPRGGPGDPVPIVAGRASWPGFGAWLDADGGAWEIALDGLELELSDADGDRRLDGASGPASGVVVETGTSWEVCEASWFGEEDVASAEGGEHLEAPELLLPESLHPMGELGLGFEEPVAVRELVLLVDGEGRAVDPGEAFAAFHLLPAWVRPGARVEIRGVLERLTGEHAPFEGATRKRPAPSGVLDLSFERGDLEGLDVRGATIAGAESGYPILGGAKQLLAPASEGGFSVLFQARVPASAGSRLVVRVRAFGSYARNLRLWATARSVDGVSAGRAHLDPADDGSEIVLPELGPVWFAGEQELALPLAEVAGSEALFQLVGYWDCAPRDHAGVLIDDIRIERTEGH